MIHLSALNKAILVLALLFLLLDFLTGGLSTAGLHDAFGVRLDPTTRQGMLGLAWLVAGIVTIVGWRDARKLSKS